MKYRVFVAASLMLLAACNPTSERVYSDRVVQIAEACGTLGTALKAAAAKLEAGELLPEQIDRIDIARNEAAPICDNPNAATVEGAAGVVINAVERILLEVE